MTATRASLIAAGVIKPAPRKPSHIADPRSIAARRGEFVTPTERAMRILRAAIAR